jgi:FKBP-type peptidyl-prolyl cis-trans isomerase
VKQRGVKIEDIEVGDGPVVKRGDRVRIAYELSLRRGDLVESVLDFTFKVGERRVIAGLEYGVEGMHVGGTRTITVPPHLGYREAGVPGRIPANAALVFKVHLLERQEA